MATSLFFQRYGLVQQASGLLRGAGSLDDILETLRATARTIAQADGVTVVRRDGDQVHYVGEDAIAPLWTGKKFPVERCISGIAMLERRPIIIPNIAADERVPYSAYLGTFVKSMAMFPLGAPAPAAALGLYWREVGPLPRDAEVLVGLLAQSANAAFQQLAIDAEQASYRRADRAA